MAEDVQVSILRGYPFERPVYLYTWPVLVIITFLPNVCIVAILLKKEMRNPTNIALTALAITDSLTGLVTLPPYILVYSKLEVLMFDAKQVNETGFPSRWYYYRLDPTLCECLMLTRFYVSQSFHTMSIWLTLFLGIQRFCGVKYPFKAKFIFTARNTVIVCVAIITLSPILHIYVYIAIHKYKRDRWCGWGYYRSEDVGAVVYMWVSVGLKHILPCVILVYVTVVVIFSLVRGRNVNTGSSTQRVEENRRVSIIVTVAMVVFLIPEVPYGICLVYLALEHFINLHMHLNITHEWTRAIQATYETMSLLSFHANFWIYTILNRRFRKLLLAMLCGNLRHLARRLFANYSTSETTRDATDREGNTDIGLDEFV